MPLTLRAVLIAAFLLTPAAVHAGCGDFMSPVSSPAPGVIGSFADFDGDEKLDLVVTAFHPTNTMTILFGDNSGAFPASVSYSTKGTTPINPTVADLNNDSKPDIVVSNAQSAAIAVFINAGNGALNAATTYAAGSNPRASAVADFNGDNKLDVAVTNIDSASVSVFFGNGDGTLQPGVLYRSGGTGQSTLFAGDFTSDDRADLIVGQHLLVNSGAGAFGDPVPLEAAPSVVTHFNHDGMLDVVVAHAVCLGDGQGRFPTCTPIPDARGNIAALGDLNGDGRLDALLSTTDGVLQVALQNAGGTFAPPAFNYLMVNGALIVADFDNDGHSDVVGVNSGQIATALGVGDGTLVALPAYLLSTPSPGFPGSVAVGDFDEDGNPDLVVARDGTSSATITVLLAAAPGQYPDQLHLTVAPVPHAVAVADLNRDTYDDIIVACGGFAVSVLLGHGDGTFAPAVNYSAGNFPVALAVDDFNGDQKLDVAVANQSFNNISIFLGNGDGTLGAAVNYNSGGTMPNSLATADFNNDRNTDIVVTNHSSNVTVLFGNGDGTFGTPQVVTSERGRRSVATGDLNGDGNSDFVVGYVASLDEQSLLVFLGNGNGGFISRASSIRPGSNVHDLALADFNRDDALDAFVALSNGAAVLFGNGNGMFQPAKFYDTISTPESSGQAAAAADLTGDGSIDVVMTHRRSETIAPFLNLCPSRASTLSSAGDVVGAGDFNGDGKADVLLRDATGDVGMWLMNGPVITAGAFVGSPGVQYRVAAIADFDGDAKADVLLHDGAGNLGMWFMDGPAITAGGFVGSPGPAYSVAGAGDFDGDGHADILLRDDNGSLGLWFMNGAAIASAAFVGSPGTVFSVVGVADFNADGRADVLLQDPYGKLGMWLMNGSSIVGGARVGWPTPTYSTAGAADFDGDGKADILLRSIYGDLQLWTMNGMSVTATNAIGSPGAYAVSAVRDYDGDGRADILLRNTFGVFGMWLMNGPVITNGADVGAPGSMYVAY